MSDIGYRRQYTIPIANNGLQGAKRVSEVFQHIGKENVIEILALQLLFPTSGIDIGNNNLLGI